MDASSSSCFYTAKAEESPSSVVDAVAESESLTMVGAEGTSTSGRSEYYSARCEEMLRRRDQFSDDVALEIEFSKPHWSEVVREEVAPQSAEEEKLNRENKEVLDQLKKEHPLLFGPSLSLLGLVHPFLFDFLFGFHRPPLNLGRMIAKGGQAEIYEVVGNPNYLLKVFERGTSLRDLQQSWPLPVLKKHVQQCIFGSGMLEDGRFAFFMWRWWGDLRKLIDQAMQEKNVDGVQGPPFPYKWKDYILHPTDLMLEIARQMLKLHEKSVFHRDLKASNILVGERPMRDDDILDFNPSVLVADYECSIGVLGTGFWRAPEIMSAQAKRETISNEQWEKADVYSYGMTCFEMATGQLPFDHKLKNNKAGRQLVIDGERPQLPSDLDEAVKDLITKCWATDPRLRPTFSEIVVMMENIPTRQCKFRLFGIAEELPPQYHLATVEEVADYPFAVYEAMPHCGMDNHCRKANLANGSVDSLRYGMKIRLEKRSNVRYKLARLHQ